MVGCWQPATILSEGFDMITRIEIEGFKSLKNVKLDLGPVNLFVGTNASGKSNL